MQTTPQSQNEIETSSSSSSTITQTTTLPLGGENDGDRVSFVDFYRDKTLFCTGCTGFVGKVYIEKVLRSLPDVRKIYVLVRPNQKRDAKERLLQEVIRSPVMNVLRERMGNDEFEQFALSKLEAVPGDVTDEKVVRVTVDKLEEMRNSVNIVVHSAATIDFQERLDRAIRMNVYGSLAVLEFAKSCKNIQSFCHVSTCYVNSNQESGSRIAERLYRVPFPVPEDIAHFCRRVVELKNEKEILRVQKRYLKHANYPNTYTFTKAMTEHLLVRNHGNIPLAITRPSIVAASAFEPFPGWIDAVSAFGAMALMIGLGVVQVVPGYAKGTGDTVPVDYVSNAMIICAADIVTRPTEKYRVYQVASSSVHPMKWSDALYSIPKYFRLFRPRKRIADPYIYMARSYYVYRAIFFLRYTVPTSLLAPVAYLSHSKYYLNMYNDMKKLESKAAMLAKLFQSFTMQEWIFEAKNLTAAYKSMIEPEKRILYLDYKNIDWKRYTFLVCYGLHRWILKDDMSVPQFSNGPLPKTPPQQPMLRSRL